MHLADIAETQSGYTFRSKLKPEPEGDISVVQMKDISDTNRLELGEVFRTSLPSGKPKRHLLQPGDLLFRSRGRSYGAALVPERIGSAVLAAPLLRIRPTKVLPEYLYWFINTPGVQERLTALATGTSVQMITIDALKSLEVPVPSLARQRVIAHASALVEREQALMQDIAARRMTLATHILMKTAIEAKS